MFRIIHPNRWFFWTIAILISIGLVLLFFINQASQEFERHALELTKPIEWKTFRSDVLGIALRYPPGWQIEIDPQAANTVYFENPQNFNENISLSVVKPSLERVIRNSLKISSEEEIIADSVKGVWLKGQEARDVALSNVVLIRKEDKLYYFAGTARDFERIIKGIRFLN